MANMFTSYLSIVGNYLLPSYLLIMILLAIGIGRKYLVVAINYTVGMSVNVSGFRFYIFPTLIVASVICGIANYMELVELNKTAEDQMNNLKYMKSLYQFYRNMLVHFCHVIMGTFLFFSTRKFQEYQDLVEQTEHLEQEMKSMGVAHVNNQ